MNKLKIIAEAGVNHNGSIELAKKLVDAAFAAGADIVKFQTYKTEKLVTRKAAKAKYQESSEYESQFEMLKRLELSEECFREIQSYCESVGIEFLSTAFDFESLDFLVNDLSLKALKVPSGELSNAPLVLEHARTHCKLIVSTGMATLAEVERALGVIAFGLLDKLEQPSELAFRNAYISPSGQKLLKEYVSLLHCTSEYPAPVQSINLKSMDTLKYAFGLNTGFSDHSSGIAIPIAAAARGANIIEKHFTLSRDLPGPDHKASLEPHELKEMIHSIRSVEYSLGSSIKAPSLTELQNSLVAGKSLVAKIDIKAGENFSEENLITQRPGNGLSPYLYWEYLNKKADRDYITGDLI
ncbi:MAG: N-acetylneuraminate synthase [Lentisphaeraceae bacterium]|nr:N-acetylneuraminate synthase [Lentisphaeraceae bacterium]